MGSTSSNAHVVVVLSDTSTMGTFSDRGGSSSCVAGLVIVGIGLFGLGLATGMFFPWTGEAGGDQARIYDQDDTSLTPIPVGTPKLLISSTGIAIEYRGIYLGLYELQKETYKTIRSTSRNTQSKLDQLTIYSRMESFGKPVKRSDQLHLE